MQKNNDYTLLRTEEGGKVTILKPVFDILRNNRNGKEVRALVLESKDAANVVPITADGKIVMVRQYRFGSRSMSLELPGGLIDAGEDPKLAALRELKEETGYEAKDAIDLGASGSNPAYINADIFHFAAKGVIKTGEQSPDDGENLTVVLVDPKDLVRLIQTKEIHHPHAIVPLSKLFDLRTIAFDSFLE